MSIVLSAFCAFLLFLLQRMIYKRIWKRNLGVTVSFVTPFAVEGETGTLKEVIENKKLFPVPVLRVKFSFARGLKLVENENVTRTDKFYKNDIFSVMPYMRITRTHSFLCEKRGYYVIDSVSLSSSDLLMSSNFVENRQTDTHFMVYPAGADMKRLIPMFSEIMGEREVRACIKDPFSFSGIRDYERSDSMRDINWKATAKTGELKVNVHNSTQTEEARIILDLEPDSDWVDNGLREEAIRIAASLSALFVKRGVTVSLAGNCRDILTDAALNVLGGCSAGHINAIKSALARIDLQKECLHFQDFIGAFLEEDRKTVQNILITVAKSPARIAEYSNLAKEKDGCIIFLLTRPDTAVTEIPGGKVIRWEVRY